MSINKTNRIQFYSKDDGATPHELTKAEKLLETFNVKTDYGINDLLEFYNVKLYFDNNLFLSSWTEVQRNIYIQKTEAAYELLKKSITRLEEIYLANTIQAIEYKYRKNLWKLIDNLNAYKRISAEAFMEVMENNKKDITYILLQKGIIEKFDKKIREFLLVYKGTAELLLTKLEEKHLSGDSPAYLFPKSLTLSDKEAILDTYLDSEKANLNYVRLIENSKDSNDLKLSNKTRLKAKKKSKALNEQILENGYTWRVGVQVGISESQVEPVKYNNSENLTEVIYSESFLNLFLKDPVKLFKLFSRLFQYLDGNNLITLFSKESELDTFEKFHMTSKNAYEKGAVFIRKEYLSNLQLILMDKYLKSNDTTIEKIINSFVEYLNTLIAPNNFTFTIDSESNNYVERIRHLAPDYEFLLKQFKFLAEEGEIDLELIQVSSEPVRLGDIRSMYDKKYFYGNGNDITYIKNIFFSNQSFLRYTKKFDTKYENAFELLSNENILFEDFENYQQSTIEKLIADGHLKISDEGFVKFQNIFLMIIVKNLYEEEVMTYSNYAAIITNEVNRLVSKQLLRPENTLLTIQERNYFNYYLNKKEFTNGYDLRNKYLHGTNPSSAEQQEMDYLMFLKIVILTLLKMEDDILLSQKNR